MAPVKKTNKVTSLKKRAYQKKRFNRVKLYGPEVRTNVRVCSDYSFVSGTSTSDFGWVYGIKINLTAAPIVNGLPSHTREIKVLKIVNNIWVYLYPDDQSSSVTGQIIPKNKSGQNNYWPTNYDVRVTSMGDPNCKFFVAVMLEDQDSDTGDTAKYDNIGHLMTIATSRNFRFGSESSVLRFTRTWTPQEPTEREWIGRQAAGNSSHLCRLVVAGTHLLPTGWAKAGTQNSKTRMFGVTVESICTVVYRGKISTTSVISPFPATETSSTIPSPSGDFYHLRIDE